MSECLAYGAGEGDDAIIDGQENILVIPMHCRHICSDTCCTVIRCSPGL